jgi:ribosomal protein S18 acetylase RimI-like enzyme
MQITPAQVEDAPAIAQVIAQAFPPSVCELTIYGCPGVARYVADSVRARSLSGDTLYTVARDAQGLAGCVEIRRLPRELCLNYIAVAAAGRARGLGRALFLAALEAPECQDYERLVLDVFEFNTVALNWYHRLGFAARHQTGWYVLPPLHPAVTSHHTLEGFAQAEAAHERFGFSQFRLVTAKGNYAVGRLGAAWFRVTQPGALADDDFLPALARVDAQRRVLFLTKQGESPGLPSNTEKRLTTISMVIAVRQLRAKLRASLG